MWSEIVVMLILVCLIMCACGAHGQKMNITGDISFDVRFDMPDHWETLKLRSKIVDRGQGTMIEEDEFETKMGDIADTYIIPPKLGKPKKPKLFKHRSRHSINETQTERHNISMMKIEKFMAREQPQRFEHTSEEATSSRHSTEETHSHRPTTERTHSSRNTKENKHHSRHKNKKTRHSKNTKDETHSSKKPKSFKHRSRPPRVDTQTERGNISKITPKLVARLLPQRFKHNTEETTPSSHSTKKINTKVETQSSKHTTSKTPHSKYTTPETNTIKSSSEDVTSEETSDETSSSKQTTTQTPSKQTTQKTSPTKTTTSSLRSASMKVTGGNDSDSCKFKLPQHKHVDGLLSDMTNQITKVFVRLQQVTPSSSALKRPQSRFIFVDTKDTDFFERIFSEMVNEFKNVTAKWLGSSSELAEEPCAHQEEIKEVWRGLLDDGAAVYLRAAREFVRVAPKDRVSRVRMRARLKKGRLGMKARFLRRLCEDYQTCYFELVS